MSMIDIGNILGDLGVPTPDELQQIITAATTGADATAGAVGTVAGSILPDPGAVVQDTKDAIAGALNDAQAFAVRMGIFGFLIVMLMIGIFAVIVPVSDVIDAAQQTGKDASSAATAAVIAG